MEAARPPFDAGDEPQLEQVVSSRGVELACSEEPESRVAVGSPLDLNVPVRTAQVVALTLRLLDWRTSASRIGRPVQLGQLYCGLLRFTLGYGATSVPQVHPVTCLQSPTRATPTSWCRVPSSPTHCTRSTVARYADVCGAYGVRNCRLDQLVRLLRVCPIRSATAATAGWVRGTSSARVCRSLATRAAPMQLARPGRGDNPRGRRFAVPAPTRAHGRRATQQTERQTWRPIKPQ